MKLANNEMCIRSEILDFIITVLKCKTLSLGFYSLTFAQFYISNEMHFYYASGVLKGKGKRCEQGLFFNPQ